MSSTKLKHIFLLFLLRSYSSSKSTKLLSMCLFNHSRYKKKCGAKIENIVLKPFPFSKIESLFSYHTDRHMPLLFFFSNMSGSILNIKKSLLCMFDSNLQNMNHLIGSHAYYIQRKEPMILKNRRKCT